MRLRRHKNPETEAPVGVTRRRFLERGWKLLLAFLGIEAGITTWDFLRPRLSKGFGASISAGPPEASPEGSVRYFSDGRFYLARVDGKMRALFQKCPHLGCRVPFCESSGRFECPCHGSIFNRKGEYVAGPAPRGMDRFPLRLEGGEVVVDTGRVLPGPARGVRTLEERPGPSCLGQVEEEFGRSVPGDHGPGEMPHSQGHP